MDGGPLEFEGPDVESDADRVLKALAFKCEKSGIARAAVEVDIQLDRPFVEEDGEGFELRTVVYIMPGCDRGLRA